jgi:hypothetical protein
MEDESGPNFYTAYTVIPTETKRNRHKISNKLRTKYPINASDIKK